jgi:predicted glycosyl hydrolase (DUF1957 family)
MRVYRLRHKQYKGDVVFGMPPTYCKKLGEKKINEMFSNMKPWKHAIPYYNKSKFAFLSSNALITFMLWIEKLNEEEYNSICDNYFVESFEVTTWSSGLSKLLCTYFDDEVEPDTLETYDLKTVLEWTAKVIYQDPVPKESIKYCKESYYKTVKTYY